MSMFEFAKSPVSSLVGLMDKGHSLESHDLVLALANETIENNYKIRRQLTSYLSFL